MQRRREEAERLAREALRDQRYLVERKNHRASVVRRALLFTPSAILLTGLTVIAVQNLPQSIIMLIIVGIAAIAVDLEAIAALRDLPARPITTRGPIRRSWSKARFLVFGRVHYLIVERRLFEIDPLAGLELEPGDEVEIHHWPHTNIVVTLEVIEKAPRDARR